MIRPGRHFESHWKTQQQEGMCALTPEMQQIVAILAENAGAATEHLWAALMKQSVIDAWFGLIASVALAVLAVCVIRLSKEIKCEDPEDRPFVIFVTTLIVTLLLFISFCSAHTAVSGFFNPEARAIEKIIAD